eukprot:scaffold67433_cov61-Phaeocystis_antarctica.AAC.2
MKLPHVSSHCPAALTPLPTLADAARGRAGVARACMHDEQRASCVCSWAGAHTARGRAPRRRAQ